MNLTDLPDEILSNILENHWPPIYWAEIMCVNQALRAAYLRTTLECGVKAYKGTPKNVYKGWTETIEQLIKYESELSESESLSEIEAYILDSADGKKSIIERLSIFLKTGAATGDNLQIGDADAFLMSIKYNELYITHFTNRDQFIYMLKDINCISRDVYVAIEDISSMYICITLNLTFVVSKCLLQLNGPLLRKYLDTFADYCSYLLFVSNFTDAVTCHYSEFDQALMNTIQSVNNEHRDAMLQLFIDNIPSRVETITKMILAGNIEAKTFANTHYDIFSDANGRYIEYINPAVLPSPHLVRTKLMFYGKKKYHEQMVIKLIEQTKKSSDEVYQSVLAKYNPIKVDHCIKAISVKLHKELSQTGWDSPPW